MAMGDPLSQSRRKILLSTRFSVVPLLIVQYVLVTSFRVSAIEEEFRISKDAVVSLGLEGSGDQLFLRSNRKLFSSNERSKEKYEKKRTPMLLPLEFRTVNLSLGTSNRLSRSMLGNARAELLGHVSHGYYFTKLFLGTPPKTFELIVDTGSTVTYVPCANCEHCGKHADKSFVPANSSTYQVLHCADMRCHSGQCEKRNRQCMYDRHYAEESSSTGLLAMDNLSFGEHSDIGTPRIIFGCETDEEGALYQQKADGIIGLGRGPLAVPNQLASAGIIDDAFSLCYGGMNDKYTHAGAIIMGAIAPHPDMVWATTDPNHMNSQYYNLKIEGIQVEGRMLDVAASEFETGYGTLLDSGTTFTYLPKRAFDAFHTAVVANLKPEIMRVPGPDKNYPSDICFGGSTSANLEDDFPQVDIVFYPHTVLSLAPENYLFKHRALRGGYCFGFFDGDDGMGTLLGGILTRNMLVNYDRQNNRIGFLKTRCNDLMQTFPDIPDHRQPPGPPSVQTPLVNSPPYIVPSPPPPIPSSPPPVLAPEIAPSTLPSQTNEGRVQQIVVGLNLNIPKESFAPLIPGFINDLAAKINVKPTQIEVSSYESGQTANAVVLKCIVHPTARTNDSFPYFSETAAQEIAGRIRDHKIKLREIFGAYKVISVDLEPAQESDQSSQRRRRVILGAAMGVLAVVVVGLIALVIVWRRRRSPASGNYVTVNQALEEEAETALL